jgi:hypothetical protein
MIASVNHSQKKRWQYMGGNCGRKVIRGGAVNP